MKKTTKIGLSLVVGVAVVGTIGILTQICLKHAISHNKSKNSNSKITKKDSSKNNNISSNKK